MISSDQKDGNINEKHVYTGCVKQDLHGLYLMSSASQQLLRTGLRHLSQL